MNTPATVPVVLAPERLATLTKEINEAHGEVRKACRISLEAALRAGKALAEIKAALPYGAYLRHLEERCACSERSARTYVKLWESKDIIEQGLSGDRQVAGLTQTEALRMIATQKPKAGNGGGKKSQTTIKALKKAWDGASKEVQSQFRLAINQQPQALPQPAAAAPVRQANAA
jgi:Sec-independent protein translocase protein TatA